MILNRKILLMCLCCFILVLGFISPVMAEGEAEQEQTASAVTITENDRDTMNFLRDTKSGDWHTSTLDNPTVVYDAGLDAYFVNEQPMYILKQKLSGGGLPANETTITRGKTKVAIADFIQQVNAGEITRFASITYSRNKNTGMLVATEIVLR